MKETPDIKEVVKIYAMNVKLASWFLSSVQFDTFEQLFKRMLVYEKLTGFHIGEECQSLIKCCHQLERMGQEVHQEKSKNHNEGQKSAPR